MRGAFARSLRPWHRDAELIEFAEVASPRLRRMAFPLCGDWHAAEDLAQTALAQVYVSVYVLNAFPSPGTVIPVSTATNTAGIPIKTGNQPTAMAITPDGRTIYVTVPTGRSDDGMLIPVSTVTGTAGRPIKVGYNPYEITIAG